MRGARTSRLTLGAIFFGISELLVLVNITDKPQCVKMNIAPHKDYEEMLSFHKIEYGEGEITLSPYAGIWLQK